MSNAALPQFQNNDRDFQLMQSAWSKVLSPLLNQPLSKALLLKNVALVSGNTVVNHRLGRKPQGFIIADIDAAATIYRSAAFNELTLTLNSDNPCTVALMVF